MIPQPRPSTPTHPPFLTPSQERHLIARFQAGEKQAFEDLLATFQYKLRQESKKYSYAPHHERAMYASALQGFWEAVKNFDLQRKTRLWAFAYHQIKRRCIEQLAQEMKLSQTARKLYSPTRQIIERLTQAEGETPSEATVIAEVLKHHHPKGWSAPTSQRCRQRDLSESPPATRPRTLSRTTACTR